MFGKQLVRVRPREANSLQPPHTEEQAPKIEPKSSRNLARLDGGPWRLWCEAKRNAAAFVRKHALVRVPARQAKPPPESGRGQS